jgi:hypothetical protein|tara:strand:- start:2081 stop:3406 length:1326 start_codon:yes stop_codon:yes gene_type:complete
MNSIQKASALSLIAGCSYYIYHKVFLMKYKQKMVMMNSWPFHDEVLRYICMKYGDEVNSFNYSVEKVYHFNEWRFRRKEKPVEFKVHMPNECDMKIIYKGKQIYVKYFMVKDNNNIPYKLMSQHDCQQDEEIVYQLELTADTKEILTEFADEAMEWCKNEKKKIKMNTKETMNVYYYKKDYWTLLSKSPKRPLSTVYLPEDILQTTIDKTSKFFSDNTRDIYLSFGIPYKSVQLIHGPPGTGKTSLIKSIASHLDCDLYILPISKDMLDTNLVDAFSYISDNEEKERIIVIEDIDTLFDGERKEGDDHNGITLQAFLNCLDGFTCVEGTMLFLTANRPEVLDFAMIRSCRIDNKIELDYADKHQTKSMFVTFLPEQKEKFKEFYKEISHKKFTTAMLQEFLFYNREAENILDLLDEFIGIIEKNDPKNFEVIKEENKNFYS